MGSFYSKKERSDSMAKTNKKHVKKVKPKASQGNNPSKVKVKPLDIIFLVGILAGVMLLLYPFCSDAINNYQNQHAIQRYQDKQLKKQKKDYDKQRKKMEKENKELAEKKGSPTADPFKRTDEKPDNSKKPVSFYDEHTVGVIYIPKINVNLPIYDSTEERFLQRGTGLLEGSSNPTGGPSTHAVITGHRGLHTAKLFTDLPKLEEGDVFYIDIGEDRLAYKVFATEVVEPKETKALRIQDDKDLMTLLTCTPYMINTHRLLVKAERTDYDPDVAKKEIKKINQKSKWLIIMWLSLAILLPLGIILFLLWLKKKKEKEKEAKKKKGKKKASKQKGRKKTSQSSSKKMSSQSKKRSKR